ncbi:F0F1 ATP synthase subunit A [Oxalobacter aliiformigenes]|uniref:ATP synthase subunit a n=1 Tax=Oxalobacter aliiformigenes TaxID=2946593 RepID=A0A9E9LLG5_9BURK|nr:F0F1 ATP synthase subunit A [Oxalobacter aliiformigenes]WAV89440.1 F0F1 ATP synthase subunit A [Oxalobacter aliiformigenes]WAV91448.1 F0F1 ATP synthase subunit A [Oxalobacter aliiformigenes]WAV93528.1 F0F1 ATP synthase subunit A [Oxalobacter aliiformigenes]WAV94975.1 F0F1 ATP synthase subunit A [Oxalobacter aliiformigenes]WAV97224.1 F0F1 ATP synthase subunit A [Oxalobacter aliiformigenes]
MDTQHAPTLAEYITHHLKNLGTSHQEKIIDFSIINVDTVFWSIFCGVVACLVMFIVAKKATSGVPGRVQSAVEMLVEMVDNQAKAQIHGDRRFIAPLALTIFIWIALMNCLDFIPVDLFSQIFAWTGLDVHLPYHRLVPTSDLNAPVGIALCVIVMSIYYGLKIKGIKGFFHELFCAPFGPLMFPANILLNIIEYLARFISLSMRLWGNMYAGELIFLMIAILGSYAALSLGGSLFFIGHVIAGSVWAIFHILVVFLQAFIFMMLTLVYLGLAHESH